MSASLNSSTAFWVISSQSLVTGEVMYLSRHGWHPRLGNARLFSAQSDAEDSLKSAAAEDPENLFPSLVSVQRNSSGTLVPAHFRERFRAAGPSNRFHGKQADYPEVPHV